MFHPEKIVVASDSFKGSLASLQVADAVEAAVKEIYPSCEVVKVNVADGGEGTMDAFLQQLGGRKVVVTVSDPLRRPVEASYLILDDGLTAIMDMSSASGLTLLTPEERNPSKTSTIGTGELIRDALDRGCRRFLVGIGGSATNDAGMGMLHALGYRFFDSDGMELPPIGESMASVAFIDGTERIPALAEAEFIVACDVNAPLYGQDGAAYVFAAQKGADENMIAALDHGLHHFSEISAGFTGTDYSGLQGAGAAGGLGFAFRQFLDARLERGVDMVLDSIRFDDLIEGADLVITGEGRIDMQTLTGKTPLGIIQRASRYGIPVVAIGGQVTIDKSQSEFSGFHDIIQVTPADMPVEEAMKPEVAAENIRLSIIRLLDE